MCDSGTEWQRIGHLSYCCLLNLIFELNSSAFPHMTMLSIWHHMASAKGTGKKMYSKGAFFLLPGILPFKLLLRNGPNFHLLLGVETE